MTPILIAALLLASAAQDDAFCDPLKQIVAAAPGDYRAITGERGEDGGLRGRVLPEIDGGWDWCNVQPPEDGRRSSYSCFANREDKPPTDAELAAFANRAAGCFGPEVHATERDLGPRSFGYPAEHLVHVAQVEISLISLRTDYAVEGRMQHSKARPYLAAKPAHYYELVLNFWPND